MSVTVCFLDGGGAESGVVSRLGAGARGQPQCDAEEPLSLVQLVSGARCRRAPACERFGEDITRRRTRHACGPGLLSLCSELFAHAAVDDEVSAVDVGCCPRGQEHHHGGDFRWFGDASGGHSHGGG